MCGRYTLYQTSELASRYALPEGQVEGALSEVLGRYNLAPSQTLLTITRQDDHNHIGGMHWGFMPSWAHDPRAVFKYKTFNARSEDIFNKPLWKSAIKNARCLVPSNGFYEWKPTPHGKQPYFIRPHDQEIFSFAGVYSRWMDGDNERMSYAIVTISSNQQMATIHNRMPVILAPEYEAIWLDSGTDKDDIAALLQPLPEDSLLIDAVSQTVNTSRIDVNTLILPLNSV